jgi:hypothetical protein
MESSVGHSGAFLDSHIGQQVCGIFGLGKKKTIRTFVNFNT